LASAASDIFARPFVPDYIHHAQTGYELDLTRIEFHIETAQTVGKLSLLEAARKPGVHTGFWAAIRPPSAAKCQ
jgi:hypothetical protein